MAKKQKSDWFIITLSILLAINFIIYPFWSYNEVDKFNWNTNVNINNYEKYSTFLSFPVGIITILLVYLTYKSQKQELKETSKALKLQQIDSTFFNLITLLTNQINDISEKHKNIQVIVDLFFFHYKDEFNSHYEAFIKQYRNNEIDINSTHFIEKEFQYAKNMTVNNLVEPNLNEINKCIFTWNAIYEFINDDDVLNSDLDLKNKYFKILNAQLPAKVKSLIFYYILSTYVSYVDYYSNGLKIIKSNYLDQTMIQDDFFNEFHYRIFLMNDKY